MKGLAQHTAFGGRAESHFEAFLQAHPPAVSCPVFRVSSDGTARDSVLEQVPSKRSLTEAQFFLVCIHSSHLTPRLASGGLMTRRAFPLMPLFSAPCHPFALPEASCRKAGGATGSWDCRTDEGPGALLRPG